MDSKTRGQLHKAFTSKFVLQNARNDGIFKVPFYKTDFAMKLLMEETLTNGQKIDNIC